MQACPYCSQTITTLYSSSRRNLLWHNGKWVIDVSDYEVAIVCSACYEELGTKDLDNVGVPSELR